MQSFQITTTTTSPTGPKNYVFVDEHNRHKRLKVMRACEGCRRRKIKCDAATTNTWPCGACRRLKLPCVPPAGGIDGDQVNEQTETVNGDERKSPLGPFPPPFDVYAAQYDGQAPPVTQIPPPQYEASPPQLYIPQEFGYVQQHPGAPLQQSPIGDYRFQSMDGASQHSTPKTPDAQTAESLSDQLGELRIGENGVAPYIRQQNTSSAEPSVPVEEPTVDNIPLSTIVGNQIAIPPSLMPSDEQAAEAFRVFFEDVHPYVPVLCRSAFYAQWRSNRESISPLLLESIFACAARLTGESTGDSSWLLLANKHEPSFLDTPRLSTVQALLLLLKAREGSPKRGYFYKSWMRTRTIISMAKDLDLPEHRAIHDSGESCGFSPDECLVRTRIWQTCMICEMTIGAPQGRYDFSVLPSTIDFSPTPPHSDLDAYETKISKQFAYFARNSRNILRYVLAYNKVKRKKDWAMHGSFQHHNDACTNWPKDLPADLQLTMLSDGVTPSLPSHFVGNMHAHYRLGMIMLHRPQLMVSKSYADGQQWRHHLSLCYNAAKDLCRIQEAIVAQHGMNGLICMQRGMSFTIYAILTCTMLHLVAFTAPDPEFNTDAREFFVRHMRLLEKCMPEFPSPETQQQINNLRTAFSADLSKPFDLRKSFPFDSPRQAHSTIGSDADQTPRSPDRNGYPPQHWPPAQHPSAPPQTNGHYSSSSISSSSGGQGPETPTMFQEYAGNGNPPHFQPISPNGHAPPEMTHMQHWDPLPLMNQFNTAFQIPQTSLVSPISTGGPFTTSPPALVMPQNLHNGHFGSPTSPIYDHGMVPTMSPGGVPPQGHYFEPHIRTMSSSSIPTVGSFDQKPRSPPQASTNIQPQPHHPGMTYVTPKQWQQSVASVFDSSGLKRRFDWGLQPEP